LATSSFEGVFELSTRTAAPAKKSYEARWQTLTGDQEWYWWLKLGVNTKMATFKYISGTLGDPIQSEAKGDPSSTELDGFYVYEGIVYIGKIISLTRRPKEEPEKIEPILGLGLRKAFLTGAGVGLGQQTHTARVDKDIASLTPLEANVFENRGGAAMLSIAGVALLGPFGALAGLAAKKRGEVVFALEFKENADDENLRHQTVIASGSSELFERLKRESRAPSKATKEHIAQAGINVDGEASGSLSSEIERLKGLKDSGAITEDEFIAAKAKLLGM